MASEWRVVTLGEIAKFRAGSAFKKEYQGERTGELPFLKVSDLNLPGNGYFIRFANNWVSRDRARDIKAAHHPKGATVFAKIGVALTTNRRRLLTQESLIDNNLMSATPKEALVRPRYLYFLLCTVDFNVVAKGSALPYLNAGDLKSLRVVLPGISTQDQVLEVLEAIEDRIDNIFLVNEALEAIAQTLFKSWFVDFDPVLATAEGREPEGMDAATAALFPEKMEASEIGLIPEGWQAKPLDSIAKYINGLALQKYPPESETEFLPVIKIAQLRAGHTVGADRASMNLKPDYVVEDGDVLFSWSGSLLVEKWCGGRGALNQHLFKVTSGEVPKWFYFLATRHHLPHFREVAANKATTMGHIQRRHLAEAFIALPSSRVLEEASKLFTPLLETWLNNAQQARLLQELRNTLLPRLISGKLRLPEAKREIEAATA